MRRFNIDRYLLALMGAVLLATFLPAHGVGKIVLDHVVEGAIAFLFFLYGARLSLKSVWQGLVHWRLQSLVFGTTFIFFPVIGLTVLSLGSGHVDGDLLMGIMFLCILPSTVQSSIAFTSIARGNVPAALCSASISNVLGVVLVPVLASLFMKSDVTLASGALEGIALQLLLPFAAGQLARPLLAGIIERHKTATMLLDRGSIVLIVYSAFSAAAMNGVWQTLSAGSIVLLIAIDLVILFSAVVFTTMTSRALKFSKEDEIATVFCGSKKSLASGVPIANILFPAHVAGTMVLPIMLFHQAQLFLCAIMARNYAARVHEEPPMLTEPAE